MTCISTLFVGWSVRKRTSVYVFETEKSTTLLREGLNALVRRLRLFFMALWKMLLVPTW